jgi:hypothetical protein
MNRCGMMLSDALLLHTCSVPNGLPTSCWQPKTIILWDKYDRILQISLQGERQFAVFLSLKGLILRVFPVRKFLVTFTVHCCQPQCKKVVSL